MSPRSAQTTFADSSASAARYAPVAADRMDDDGGGEASRSNIGRPGVEPLRLQTDFGSDGGYTDEGEISGVGYSDEDDNRNDRPRRTKPALPAYTTAEEREVVRLFDNKLVPFLTLLYLLSFLDRSNIGNAKIAGLTDDLNITSEKYEWLLTGFYITYAGFEWMTLMYRLVPPHIYVSLCVFGWGVVASLQSVATSFGGMLVLRVLLGVTEAAFGPGVPFYLSHFYKREELAFRIALFISAAPMASAFASSLAGVIVHLSRDGPIAPWRTLFLVEGFPSVIVAVFAWALIPDGPDKARFLDPRQRMVAHRRLGQGPRSEYFHEPRRRKFNWGGVRKTLADPKAYITAFMFFSCNVAFSSMPVFLPTIVQDMGSTPKMAQFLSAPPYLFASAVVLGTNYFSDRLHTRSPFLITHALLSSLAYLTIAATGSFHAHLPTTFHVTLRYLCLYPAAAGFFSSITLILAWTMDNRVEAEGKGASVAILNIIGQCGPLIGTRLYPESDGPWYVRGMFVCAMFMLLVAVLAITLRVILLKENNKAASGDKADGGGDIELELVEREGLMPGRGASGRGRGSGSDSHLNRGSRDHGRLIYII